jgi:hypothetical protein
VSKAEDGFVLPYRHHARWWCATFKHVVNSRGASLLSLFAASSGFCCDCIAPPLCQRIFNADVILVGTVTDDGMESPGARPGRDTQFVIEEILKGLPKGTKTVAVNPSRETDCWIPLEKGRRYLVIARGATGDLHTGLCSGTDEIDKTGKDLPQVRRLARIPRPIASPSRNIEVRVEWWDGTPADDAYVYCATEPDDPCVARSTTAELTGAAGVATCVVPSDSPVFIAVSELRGEPYVPRKFIFGEELFQEIFLDDMASNAVLYTKVVTSTSVVGQSAVSTIDSGWGGRGILRPANVTIKVRRR